MTPDDISLWSMIGTWVSGLATTLAVIISLWLASHTRKAKLEIELLITASNEARLRLINNSNINATVDSVSLSTSKRSAFITRRSDDLLKNPLINKSHEEYVNEYTVYSNGHYQEFSVNILSLKYAYGKFLPYDKNGHLTKVIKMPPAYILVRIVGGQTFHAKVPPLFFERYKYDDSQRLEEVLKQATESPELYLRYSTEEERNAQQLERLDWYIQSKRNSLCLLL